jgi:hypothetical protein
VPAKEVTIVSADAQGLRNSLIQDIFWTRTGLLLAILLLVSAASFGLSSVVDTGTLHTLVTSLATGTLITAVVSFGQTLVTASASQRALVAPLVDESRRALQALSAEYRSLNQEYFPTHVFEPTTAPDPAFNRLMMADLRDTREYFFRGFSGRHAAVRLLLSHAEWELRAMVADPRCDSAISGRARYLLRQQGSDADYDIIEEQLREEIRIGLVGLFQARSRCSRIDITVVADPPLDRLEMFDDSVWITLFSSSTGVTTLYPRTLRFAEESFIYGMERTEFLHVCNSRTTHHFAITPGTTRAEFLTLFQKITGTPLTEDGFRALDEKFREFQRAFSTTAELRS